MRAFRLLRVALVWGLLAFSSSTAATRAEEVVEDTLVAEDDALPAADSPQVAAESVKSNPVPARPKSKYAVPDPAIELADPRTYRLKIVFRVDATEGPVKNVVAMGPIPMDWPEQHVRLISQKISSQGKCSETILKGQAAILKFQVPSIAKGGSAFVERLYEITRYRTKFLLDGEGLKISKAMPVEMREQIAGEAPGVETSDTKMIELASSLRKAAEKDGAWETIKSFWSWTRDNVKFENGDFRGALYALENRCGDCEEMSALFVGLCRLSGIPARTVWVESHDYPEFYLVDAQGKGHWIPAQVVGPPWFGEITEYRPIFQKGDRFYDPLQKTYVRYVPQTVKGSDGETPKVDFRHEIIADSDINGPSYSNAK